MIIQPSSSQDKYIINLKGGDDDYIVTCNLDIKKLREEAIKNDLYCEDSSLKPKPPGFNREIIRNRMNFKGKKWFFMNEYKLNGESKDILAENISKLKDIFPEIVTEDKIDFDKLKLILGENVETDRERYNFTWPGKTQAIKESQKQSTGTLRPCKEESKNWDTTQNLYIEGDNLEVLKLLQKTYYNKIKMIYIDPPYNTGNDFIYPDNYKDNIENYLEITGQSSKLNGGGVF